MNAGADSADQMTKMSLEAIQVAAEVTLKYGGAATKNIAVLIYAMINDKKKVRGKTSLDNLLKSDKELKVLAIRQEDLQTFCNEAKNYGVLYAVLKEKDNPNGICDIMVKAEDAAKITRIIDRFELATIDTKAIKESIISAKDDPLKEITNEDKEQFESLQKDMMEEASKKQTDLKKKNQSEDILVGNTFIENESIEYAEKSEGRKSVRKEIEQIKTEQSQKKNNSRQKSKIKKKSKGRKKGR